MDGAHRRPWTEASARLAREERASSFFFTSIETVPGPDEVVSVRGRRGPTATWGVSCTRVTVPEWQRWTVPTATNSGGENSRSITVSVPAPGFRHSDSCLSSGSVKGQRLNIAEAFNGSQCSIVRSMQLRGRLAALESTIYNPQRNATVTPQSVLSKTASVHCNSQKPASKQAIRPSALFPAPSSTTLKALESALPGSSWVLVPPPLSQDLPSAPFVDTHSRPTTAYPWSSCLQTS